MSYCLLTSLSAIMRRSHTCRHAHSLGVLKALPQASYFLGLQVQPQLYQELLLGCILSCWSCWSCRCHLYIRCSASAELQPLPLPAQFASSFPTCSCTTHSPSHQDVCTAFSQSSRALRLHELTCCHPQPLPSTTSYFFPRTFVDVFPNFYQTCS